MRRIVRAGIAAAILITPILTAAEAQAAPVAGIPKTGGVSVQVQDSPATAKSGVAPLSSTQLSNGVLTFWGVNGAQADNDPSTMIAAIQYQKNSGGQITAEFFYNEGGRTHWDQGAFTQTGGQTRSYSWGFVPLPANCSAVGGMWVSGQGTFLTPPEHPC